MKRCGAKVYGIKVPGFRFVGYRDAKGEPERVLILGKFNRGDPMDLGFRDLYFGVRLTVLSGTGAHQESQKNKKRKIF